MPVYLSFLICALSGGGCHATVPVEEPFAGMSACQMQGMMLAPQWLDQHPGWIVKRISLLNWRPPSPRRLTAGRGACPHRPNSLAVWRNGLRQLSAFATKVKADGHHRTRLSRGDRRRGARSDLDDIAAATVVSTCIGMLTGS
jgi:hypothetical protein